MGAYGAERFVAVTMTSEETLLLTEEELNGLVGEVSADADQLRRLVEDTDAHHPALKAWFQAHKGEIQVSFSSRSA